MSNKVSPERIDEARRTAEASLDVAAARLNYLFDKIIQNEGERTLNRVLALVAEFTAETFKL